MHFPITIVDDFFKNPKAIKEYGKQFSYKPCERGSFPGERTPNMGALEGHYSFFNHILSKFLSIHYPSFADDIAYNATLFFQRISNDFKNPGFVHKDDPAELTVLVYLSDHENCGTSFFEPLSFPTGYQEKHILQQKEYMYTTKDFKKELETVHDCNKYFKEILSVPSKFNRAILFDSSYFHGVKNFIDEDMKEDRLTLIGFFYDLTHNRLKYPITESSRKY